MLINFPWRMQDKQMEGLDLPSAIAKNLFTSFNIGSTVYTTYLTMICNAYKKLMKHV